MSRLSSRLLAAFVALSLGSCGKKVTPDGAAKAFFDLIQSGQTQAAYESATFAFKAQQSLKFFETALKETGLNSITSASFDPPEIKDDQKTAKVNATFETKAKGKVVMHVTLTRESGGWRVFSLTQPRDERSRFPANRFSVVGRAPDFVEPVNRQPAPDEATVKALTRDALLRFNDAVQQRNFTEFFEKCSLAWQDQLVTGEVSPNPATLRRVLTERQKEIGASRLQHAFQPFIDKDVKLDMIKDMEPIFDGPAQVSNEGLLMVSGQYATEPYRMFFTLKFYYELPKWKLFGIDVTLKK